MAWVNDAAGVEHQHAVSPVGERVGERTAAEARTDDDDVKFCPGAVVGTQPFLLPGVLLGAEVVETEQWPRWCCRERHRSVIKVVISRRGQL
jgi:hypothetical protein